LLVAPASAGSGLVALLLGSELIPLSLPAEFSELESFGDVWAKAGVVAKTARSTLTANTFFIEGLL
jgi:hypothetical protein